MSIISSCVITLTNMKTIFNPKIIDIIFQYCSSFVAQLMLASSLFYSSCVHALIFHDKSQTPLIRDNAILPVPDSTYSRHIINRTDKYHMIVVNNTLSILRLIAYTKYEVQ